ncbi:hypothetical protein IAQ61_010026 [Plenodomus lingam]|uniref:Predicted protein n=1 Tax=Leptosphaeria maculans (strain JN3 / isolate v23.1.3 / race Av1-4-5-6-7-8) TaxID=985895 RepID=E5AEV2_LEPMJ|nr:predicted protein [Plenodomus lingam JN3]KAH9862608.1 hypothetical protein IAQ61_010026 [Plenodomus lingam]CBY01741.1 predicted protein [Plenodomus lingam JN3]
MSPIVENFEELDQSLDFETFCAIGGIPEQGILPEFQIIWTKVADMIEVQCFDLEEGGALACDVAVHGPALYYSARTREPSLHYQINGLVSAMWSPMFSKS